MKKHQAHWSGLVAALLLCGIATASLYLNQRYHKQFDLSASARHSLTESSVSIVKSLQQPLKMVAVLGPERSQREAVTSLISRYQSHKPDISLEFVNPETQPARTRELQAAPGGELILTMDSREQRLQNLSERSVTAALSRLSRKAIRKAAFVTGHNERTTERQTNDDFSQLATQLQSIGFSSDEISLVTTPVVPNDIDLLVIAAPAAQYFPGEVASIINHLGNGGNLLWLIDENHDTGLRALSLELGVEPLPGVVIDTSSAAYGADSPTFAILDSFPTHAINEGLANPLLMPAATALNVTPLAGQDTLQLLRTGNNSWTETGAISGNLAFDANGTEVRGPLTTGVTIERAGSAGVQRIAVIGDADWLASQWIGNGSNLEYAQRLFNWLSADDELLAFSSPAPADGIIDPSARATLMLGGGFLLLLPLLLSAIAMWFWQRQKHG